MKNSSKALLIICIIWLYLTGFFGYNNFARFRLPYVLECFMYAMPLFMVMLSGGGIKTTMNFRQETIFLMMLPFISGLSSMFEFGQGLYETVVACIPSLIWGTYFFLHKSNVPYGKAIRFLLLFSMAAVFILTIQQISPERAMFGLRDSPDSEQIAEVRNGLYRFRIGGAGCASLFLFALYFEKTISSFNKKWLVISLCLLLYLYLTLTRQVILSALLIVFLTFFVQKKGRSKSKPFLFAIIILGSIFAFREILFGEFIEQTSEQTSSADDVRLLEYAYFSKEIFTKPMIFILGTGVPHATSSLGDYYGKLEQLFLFPSDIGIVGTWFSYGIVYVVLFLWCMYKMCVKLRNLLPTYFIVYLFSVIVILPLAFPWGTNLSNLMWCFILYIMDLEIANSKQKQTICR